MFKAICHLFSKYIIGIIVVVGLGIGWGVGGFFLNPVVSVVMPVYNREALVGRAINSILNQTYNNFEFIIVDDGSTDNTYAILSDYAKKDKRIKLLRNDRNRGISYTRNKGNAAATGTYIAVMDSDDWSHPQRLEKTVTFMQEHPTIDAVSAQWKSITETTDFQKISSERKSHSLEDKIFLPPDFMSIQMMFSNDFSNISALFKTDFVRTHRIRYAQTLMSAEDYDFWKQFLMKGGRLAKMVMYLGWVRHHRENPKEYYAAMSSAANQVSKELMRRFFDPELKPSHYGRLTDLEKCAILDDVKANNEVKKIVDAQTLDEYISAICPDLLHRDLYIEYPLFSDFMIPVADRDNAVVHRFKTREFKARILERTKTYLRLVFEKSQDEASFTRQADGVWRFNMPKNAETISVRHQY